MQNLRDFINKQPKILENENLFTKPDLLYNVSSRKIMTLVDIEKELVSRCKKLKNKEITFNIGLSVACATLVAVAIVAGLSNSDDKK